VDEEGVAPRPLSRRDAGALIGVLSLLEAHLVAGDLDPHVVGRLSERLGGASSGPAELRVALGNLNHRLRYVLGEYDEPPTQDSGLVDLYVGFPSEAAARAFAEGIPAAAAPVAVDGGAYDDGTVRWQVAVRSTTLPLSTAFELEQERLTTFAAEHGGSPGGWGSAPPALGA
jgi:hypothetical protein